MHKVYVTVYVSMTADGKILPRILEWPDGRRFEIDRIFDIRNGRMKLGASVIRYICQIRGKRRELYLENGKPILLPGGVLMREFPGARWYVVVG